MLEVTCPSCGSRLTLPPTAAGEHFRCPSCQRVFARPAQAAPAGPSEESPFDFSGGQSGTPGESLDFRDTPEAVGETRARKRAAAPAARWLRIAGSLYIVFAALYVLRTAATVIGAGGAYALGALLGGIAAAGLTVALGLFLLVAAESLARGGDRQRGKVNVAAILGMLSGVLLLLAALASLWKAVGMYILIFRGGEFADRWAAPSALGTGLLFLVVGACSLVAGIKALPGTRSP